MRSTHLLGVALGLLVLVAGTIVIAAGAGMEEVWRLQQQRDQQQMELRLRMQQQQNRAVPSAAPVIDGGQRQRELAQQQRQRELHDRQNRAAVAAPAALDPALDQPQREIEAQRARQERIELMQRRE